MESKSAKKSKRAFSLLEVVITVAILSTAIVFVFRGFATVLVTVRLSQNMTLACFLAEDRLWELEVRQAGSLDQLGNDRGELKMQGRDFNWSYQTTRLENSRLIKLELGVSWKENNREKEYQMDFLTYLLPRK